MQNGQDISARIQTFKSTVNGVATEYEYTYNSKGNITSISVNGNETYRYVYDNLGQLIREDNGATGKTYVYTYDNAGNITSAKVYPFADDLTDILDSYYSNAVYSYSDSAWGDILTSYNGSTITYDNIGNPLQYINGLSFSWTGRQLTGATKGSDVYSFTYNKEEIRTSKTVNGVTTTYYLDGSKVIGEETNGNVTLYLYDNTGIIGMQYRASSYDEGRWDVYWFEKNLQGDVVAVYSNEGTKLLSYTYDGWGNFTVAYHNGATSATLHNPFTYRGYYYDSDLGLYYLNSRYYDSNTRRFINADAYTSTGQGIIGNNMFAYCGNNPIARVDYSGQLFFVSNLVIAAIFLFDITVCATAAAKVTNVILSDINYEDNSKVDSNPDTTTQDKILDVQEDSNIKQIKIGFQWGNKNACEAMALHNALVLLGYPSNLSTSIKDLQDNDAMLLFGLFGNNPNRIGDVLDEKGIQYSSVELNELDKPGVYIISYWNENAPWGGLHTVAVTYDGTGYFSYNQDENDKKHPSEYTNGGYICGYYLG